MTPRTTTRISGRLMAESSQAAFTRQPQRVYGGYVLGLLVFIALLAGL